MTISSFQGEYRFLSNFYPALIIDNKQRQWPTAEHAYQAMKSSSPTEQEFVRVSSSPGEAKRRGRKVSVRSDWEEIKVFVMRRIVRAKFFQNPSLAASLVATGSQTLVETNKWHDNFWGNCVCSRCHSIPGENHLGLILMEVREDY